MDDLPDVRIRDPWWRKPLVALGLVTPRYRPGILSDLLYGDDAPAPAGFRGLADRFQEAPNPRPLRAIHVEEMRLAARAWRGALPRNQSIHDRVDDLIDEIDRLRKRVEAADALADNVNTLQISGNRVDFPALDETLAAYRATKGQSHE